MCKGLVYVTLFGLVLAISGQATAGIMVAEQLLVDLRADELPYGAVTQPWISHGTLGDFAPKGAPKVEDVGGRKAVTFNGSSYFEGPLSIPGIQGAGTRSIEVWAYNGPDFVSEETMVSWSHRGGPDGTNLGFNYGNNTTWGAVGHWGAADMPWSGVHSPAPAANNWWYLVYTYDGTTVRLYVNAEENTVRAAALNTHGPNIIRVAAQSDDAGTGVLSTVNFTGSIAEVRIHDGVLSPAAIANNFKSKPGNQTASAPLPADGQTDVPVGDALAWTAGEFAALHDVYLGTTFADVNAAGRDNPLGVLVSQDQAEAAYAPADAFEYGTTYYWRIDEVNAAPDNTIYAGSVWSFTTESYGYPIENITATASSSQGTMGPENTINGSGLNANDEHSTASTDMWMTTGGKPAWIQYEFDQAYSLYQMWVWNSNQAIESFLGFGAKAVTVEYSLDGQTWSALGDFEFAQATGTPTYTANTTVSFNGVQAKFVKLTINANWGGLAQTGLAEVRFFYAPVQAFNP
ncbi:MAG: LamG-like jellyroll fold domain-containing protein, partial [Solirubrobacterales bacterium]